MMGQSAAQAQRGSTLEDPQQRGRVFVRSVTASGEQLGRLPDSVQPALAGRHGRRKQALQTPQRSTKAAVQTLDQIQPPVRADVQTLKDRTHVARNGTRLVRTQLTASEVQQLQILRQRQGCDSLVRCAPRCCRTHSR